MVAALPEARLPRGPPTPCSLPEHSLCLVGVLLQPGHPWLSQLCDLQRGWPVLGILLYLPGVRALPPGQPERPGPQPADTLGAQPCCLRVHAQCREEGQVFIRPATHEAMAQRLASLALLTARQSVPAKVCQQVLALLLGQPVVDPASVLSPGCYKSCPNNCRAASSTAALHRDSGPG